MLEPHQQSVAVTLMSSTVYLASRTGNVPYDVSTPERSTDTMVVYSITYSEPNFLQEILRREKIALTIYFGNSNSRGELHYHPGAFHDREIFIWDLLGGLLKSGSSVATVAGEMRNRGSYREIPPSIITQAAGNGIGSVDLIHKAFDHLADSNNYPREGYYLNSSQSSTLVINGKIRPHDLV